jgi:benzoyl-CoA reductase/2-hydroxyglutaryl-CoA dehydratase subunit BcrC/BadD/HgdB
MKKIGITTTVPIEVLLAAGYQPVDLNNIFISDDNPERLVSVAEKAGFPLNCCSWIKGLYGVCMEHNIDTVLCVTTGDCSNTVMLMEVLKLRGVKTIPFAYPDRADAALMQRSLEELARTLNTTLEAADKVAEQLKPGRELAWRLDELTWKEGLVSGYENHLWLVSASDFNRDDKRYRQELGELIERCLKRKPYPPDCLRIAYLGVPSVYGRDLYNYLETQGARVVFNEIQRQFAMPHPSHSLAEQYASYTYPYSIYDRLKDISAELAKRRADGVIHYVQAFCHRGIGDIIFRDKIKLPVLTLEGNDDFHLNQHLKTRVEAFIDMLQRSRRRTKIAEEVQT